MNKKDLHIERLYEVITRSGNEKISWPIAAPNKRAARAIVHFLKAIDKSLKIVAVQQIDSVIVSPETAKRIKRLSR